VPSFLETIEAREIEGDKVKWEGLGFAIVDPLCIDYEQRDEYCFVPLKPKTTTDFGVFRIKSAPPAEAIDEFINCLKDFSTKALSGFK
jgi:hypothetical protein